MTDAVRLVIALFVPTLGILWSASVVAWCWNRNGEGGGIAMAASDLHIGMMVRDNDPRDPGRIMVIHAIHGNKVVLSPRLGQPDQSETTRVSATLIFTDGKPRKSGWSVVP